MGSRFCGAGAKAGGQPRRTEPAKANARETAGAHLANGAAVEKGILRDDGQPGPERIEADAADVDAVDVDLAAAELDDPLRRQRKGERSAEGSWPDDWIRQRGTHEERLQERRLSGAGPADDADLLPRAGGERDALEDLGQALTVAEADVLEVDDAAVGPRGGRVVGRRPQALGSERAVVCDALGRVLQGSRVGVLCQRCDGRQT